MRYAPLVLRAVLAGSAVVGYVTGSPRAPARAVAPPSAGPVEGLLVRVDLPDYLLLGKEERIMSCGPR